VDPGSAVTQFRKLVRFERRESEARPLRPMGGTGGRLIRGLVISSLVAGSMVTTSLPARAQAVEIITYCNTNQSFIAVDITEFTNVDPNRVEWLTWQVAYRNTEQASNWNIGPWNGLAQQGPGIVPFWQEQRFNVPPGRYDVWVQFAWWYDGAWDLRWVQQTFYFSQDQWALFPSPDGTCNTHPSLFEVGFDGSSPSLLERFSSYTPVAPHRWAPAAKVSAPFPHVGVTGSAPCDAPTITGTTEDDLIYGTDGNDVIAAGEGSDQVLGGPGDDVICGGDGPLDRISGGGGHDLVFGELGSDILWGNVGGDSLNGGSDLDIVDGGAGADQMTGDGYDLLGFLSATRGVGVDLGKGKATGAGKDRFDGFIGVIGSDYDDVLIGSNGADVFVPYLGDDAVVGGSGVDELDYLIANAAVNVNLQKGWGRGEGSDTVSSMEIVVGSDHDDVLRGSIRKNVLLGWDGDDRLIGAGGVDTLVGGDGIDTCLASVFYVSCDLPSGISNPEPPAEDEPPNP
jgi:RTX calcium-binding nonapeptide repeat (4 copies)